MADWLTQLGKRRSADWEMTGLYLGWINAQGL